MSGPSLVGWAYLNGVELDFTWPGKPTDNTVMEAFNVRFRGQRRHYNRERPHGAWGRLLGPYQARWS